MSAELSHPETASGKVDSKWTLILPCAEPLMPARSRRPKWLLTAPTGELMVQLAAASMPAKLVGDIVIAFLREAEAAYHCTEAIRRAFDGRARCVVLDKATAGPAETVRQVIEQTGLTGRLCIKDSDSFFRLDAIPDSSFLAVADISARRSISRPGGKSYVRVNEQGFVADIVEKNIISSLISCGLYGFAEPEIFVAEFDQLASQLGHRGLFVSHVMSCAVQHGRVFLPVPAKDYIDLETTEDLSEYRGCYATIVVDIDGVVFRNQSRFFPPYWGEPVDPIQENIDHVRALQAQGAQLIFMTARPEEFREVTVASLERVGLRPHALVMDCHHSTRFLVNDYAQSNPYPSAVAINVERNRPTLAELLLPGQIRLDRKI